MTRQLDFLLDVYYKIRLPSVIYELRKSLKDLEKMKIDTENNIKFINKQIKGMNEK